MNATVRVSLPDDLKRFVDARVRSGGYASPGEYIRAVLRERQKHEKLVRSLARELKTGKHSRRWETVRIG
ncbi:MAG TPA: ribbon-helix-helix domain-containing protein [Gaiellaceae bacterium]|nr:ribbon-helix-helix domain-containing protein [Gaiellaceae bacterium]